MKKRLLFAFMAMCTAVSSFAITVSTKTGCYLTTGENICANGSFADADFTGWTPVSATEGTACSALFSYSKENQSISSTSNLYSEGMYYKFAASSAEPYVVTFKIRQVNGAWPFSTNVLYTTAEEVNTYGCQGSNGVGKNYISLFGNNGGVNSNTDFVNAGYAIQLSADWQTVTFATIPDGVTRDWYFYICNMATDVEIQDIEIYPAVEVADVRKAVEPLAFAKAIRDAYAWDDSDDLAGLKETIELVEGITTENSAAELTEVMEGLQDAVNTFIAANLDDYLASCKKGSKWADVTTKGQKIKTIGDWSHFYMDGDARNFNTDRMMHCNSNDAAAREASKEILSIPDYGFGSALGDQGLIMTKELKRGAYIFSMNGNCHTFYQSNTPYQGANGYQSNDGFMTGHMVLSIEDADGNVIGQNSIDVPAALDYAQNLVTVNIPADGTYNFVVNFTQPMDNNYYGASRSYGGSYYLTTPQIYCKLEGYNAAQLAYIEAVKAQVKAGRDNYDAAINYQADETYLWGKADLKACTDTMLVKLQKYEAYDDAAIVATFDKDTYEAGATNENALLEHEVYVEVAKDLIAANKKFLAVNDTLNSIQVAIDAAEATMVLRLYDAATGKADLQAAIDVAKATQAQMKATEYSEENAATIKDAVAALNEAVETFKTTIPASDIVEILSLDFANGAKKNAEETAYEIEGTNTVMTISNFAENTPTEDSPNAPFELGFDDNGEKKCADVLRVGNGTASATIPAKDYGTNILKVSMDFWFVRVSNGYAGFNLLDENSERVAGFVICPYNNAISGDKTSFGYDDFNIANIGSFVVGNTAGDAASCADNNKTHIDCIFDYGEKTMYMMTTTPNGSQTSEKVEFNANIPTTFNVVGDYSTNTARYRGRRSWFDNLKIEQISAGAPVVDGIAEVNAAATVKAPTKVLKNGRIIINGKYAVNGMLVK